MTAPAERAPAVRRLLGGLAWDAGLPVAVYYALHLLGASDWVALLAAAGAAAVRVVAGVLRHRRLNQFAVLMLVVYGTGLLLAFVTGDARTLLLRSSLTTATVGLAFLVTAAVGRPLTLTAMQAFDPAGADRLAERYAQDPRVRRGFRLVSTVWGVGLLAESLVRVPLVYALPVEVAVAATEGLLVATMLLLAGWNAWYLRRARDVLAP